MPKVICKDLEGKKHKVDSSELKFRPSVYGVLIENNKILLSKQWDGYDFPGGGVHIHEAIENALEREFWEETGVKVKKDKIITTESSFFVSPFSGNKYHSIMTYFTVKQVGGKLSKDNFDEQEKGYLDMPEWVSLDDVGKIKFYNSIDSLKIIRKVLTF